MFSVLAGEALLDWIFLDQYLIIVLEEKPADDFDAMRVLFQLRQDHFPEFVRRGMSLGREDAGDFHDIVL
jgi:hypothetical protein